MRFIFTKAQLNIFIGKATYGSIDDVGTNHVVNKISLQNYQRNILSMKSLSEEIYHRLSTQMNNYKTLMSAT